jgi:hypothetical protein
MTRSKSIAIVIALATLAVSRILYTDGPLLIQNVVDVTFPHRA